MIVVPLLFGLSCASYLAYLPHGPMLNDITYMSYGANRQVVRIVSLIPDFFTDALIHALVLPPRGRFVRAVFPLPESIRPSSGGPKGLAGLVPPGLFHLRLPS